jgi:hypothetical protein
MNKYLIVGPLLIAIGLATVLLSGCSVNVIVAPHATLAVESDLGQSSAVVRYNGPGSNPNAMRDACEAQPYLLICQE